MVEKEREVGRKEAGCLWDTERRLEEAAAAN